MKNRILLKEIPASKFHSAVFTTYSINLYYLEQQVLPLLGSKNIHYISILVDGAMLSSQLENYGHLSQKRKRNYSLHGIQSNGSFHPKLIFLTGQDSALLLVGSGNLTSSGHGKNLEVWNAVYVDSTEDAKYGIIVQAWNYMKQLHADLGESANNKLKNIEKSCSLLFGSNDIESEAIYELDKHSQISFLANKENSSMFKQISEIIGDDTIKKITIMCPYHDIGGRFIHELNKRYFPKQISVLVQKSFGALPHKMTTLPNVRFYEWTDLMKKEHKQSYFHAKNIVLEGGKKNYLISGSANASIAAYGGLNFSATNEESCIMYQSTRENYLKLLSIEINAEPVNLLDYELEEDIDRTDLRGRLQSVFIKSAEKNFGIINLTFDVKDKIKNTTIQLFGSKGILQHEEEVSLKPGINSHQVYIRSNISLMFVQVSIDGETISNRQFITDIIAFESTNPSPKNQSLNQIKKLIESGDFSTLKIINYLNTIYSQRVSKRIAAKADLQDESKDTLPDESDDEILYLSYTEIQERAKEIKSKEKVQNYVEYRGVRLWESILIYLKDSRKKVMENEIDEEETENINSSEGRNNKVEARIKNKVSKARFEKTKRDVGKFLDEYYDIVYDKIKNPTSEQPTLIDLSMYLIMLQILLHLMDYKEFIKEEDKEESLFQLSFSKLVPSWTECMLQYIGMFTMWCNKTGGFKDIDNEEYRQRLDEYKTIAFKTSVAGLTMCSLASKAFEFKSLEQWIKTNLLNVDLVFNTSNLNYADNEEFKIFIPNRLIEDYVEQDIDVELANNLSLIRNLETNTNEYIEGEDFRIPNVGYCYLDKIIPSTNTTFLKLFNPAYEWDDEIDNYWNGKVYNIMDHRWIRSRKE